MAADVEVKQHAHRLLDQLGPGQLVRSEEDGDELTHCASTAEKTAIEQVIVDRSLTMDQQRLCQVQ